MQGNCFTVKTSIKVLRSDSMHLQWTQLSLSLCKFSSHYIVLLRLLLQLLLELINYTILDGFKVSLIKGTLLQLLNKTCSLLKNLIWVLFNKTDTAKHNCHISIRMTICLPRLHTVDCSTSLFLRGAWINSVYSCPCKTHHHQSLHWAQERLHLLVHSKGW